MPYLLPGNAQFAVHYFGPRTQSHFDEQRRSPLNMGLKPKPARVTSTPESRVSPRGKPPKSVGLRETEQALRDTENRFRAFVEQSSDMLSLLDEHGRIIYQSKSVLHHLGYE